MFILVFQPEVLFGSLFTLNTNLILTWAAGLEITESPCYHQMQVCYSNQSLAPHIWMLTCAWGRILNPS